MTFSDFKTGFLTIPSFRYIDPGVQTKIADPLAESISQKQSASFLLIQGFGEFCFSGSFSKSRPPLFWNFQELSMIIQTTIGKSAQPDHFSQITRIKMLRNTGPIALIVLSDVWKSFWNCSLLQTSRHEIWNTIANSYFSKPNLLSSRRCPLEDLT